MARITVSTAQLASVGVLLRKLVRLVRRLALVGAAAVAVIAALLWEHGGFDGEDGLLTLILLAAPAILLFFAQSVGELLSMPERLRRMPGEGQERLAELASVAGGTHSTRAIGLPLLLWRLRSTVGSVRGVAGVALPLKAMTPTFLAAAAVSALACLALAGVAVIALLVVLSG